MLKEMVFRLRYFGLAFALFAGTGFAENQTTGYDYWMTFRPGTFVAFLCRNSGTAGNRELLKTFTVAAVNPDSVVVDYREELPGGSKLRSSKTEPLQAGPITFRALDRPFENTDLFGGYLGINFFPYFRRSGDGSFTETAENVAVKDVPIETVRAQSAFGAASVRNTIIVWRNPQFPGQIVKFSRWIEGSASLKEEGVVVDYRTLKASAAEISRLQSERRLVPIEESASSFLVEELRLFQKDLESFQLKQEPLVKMYQNVDPSNPTIDWNALIEATQKYREGIREIKDHLSEDNQKIKGMLKPGDFEKLAPFLNQLSIWADLFAKYGDLLDPGYLAVLSSSTARYEEFLSLKKEMEDYIAGYRSAYGKALEELNALKFVKITYIRKFP